MVQKRDKVEFEILGCLLKSEAHIRAIEKEIKIPHATVIRKLEVLEKRGIVDFKVIGKNKQYFINKRLKSKKMLEAMEKFKLLNLFEKYPNLEPLFEEIVKKLSSEKTGMIILFGSYAKNIPKKESDIDIYIETEDQSIIKKMEAINSKLSVKIGKFNKDSLLIKEIIKNHIILDGEDRFYEHLFN